MNEPGAAALPWTVYMLRCRNGALYTGITTDLSRRLTEHEGIGGRGARALRGRGPLRVAYQTGVADRALASRVERLIKRLPKHDKEALVTRQPTAPTLLQFLGLDKHGDEISARPRDQSATGGDLPLTS